ncbi:DNA cytosine methyltransferase [Agrobacterium vitis]|nr:DNA cytosine methyltransferase [Agrobacterium vitis]
MNCRPSVPSFALDNRMTVVLFAGMGGGCDGLEQAGFHVHLAINHDPIAVAVHKARHPHTRHERCDVFEVCPKQATKGRGVRVLHASPDCTHFSVAKGGKPVSKRRRSLAWVVCRWAGQVRPETITLENVPEIQTWGPLIAKRCPHTGRVMRLDGSVAAKGERVPVQEQWLIPDPKHKGRIWTAWRKHMAGLDYNFEGKVLVCADYGIATIRKRFFGILQADGGKIVWPERTHAPRKIAKSLGLKPWVGAHTIIDFSIPVKSIFGRKKDLAPATLRRTARGVMRYVIEAAKPFIVPITHTKGSNQARSADDPLCAITTAKGGENMVAVPSLAPLRDKDAASYMSPDCAHFTPDQQSVWAKNSQIVCKELMKIGVAKPLVSAASLQRQFTGSVGAAMEEPAPTFESSAKTALVAASLQRQFGESNGADIEEPVPTLVAEGQSKTALVSAFLAQHNDGPKAGINARDVLDPVSALTTAGSQQGFVAASILNLRGSDKAGRDMREPVSTLCANGNHAGLILGFLQHYYGTGGQDQSLADPLGALTSKARHGLVTVKIGRETFVITDIGMRMLEPEEGAAAHGFAKGSLPDTIVLDGKTVKLTKTQKYHLVGNSVPPHMVRLLAECNVRRELVLEAAE